MITKQEKNLLNKSILLKNMLDEISVYCDRERGFEDLEEASSVLLDIRDLARELADQIDNVLDEWNTKAELQIEQN